MVNPCTTTSERLFFCLALVGVLLCGLSVVALAALGSTIEQELRISHTQLGLLQSAVFAGNAAMSFVFSAYLRRYSLRSFGMLSLLLLAAGNVMCAVPAFAALLAGRFCMGLANCGLMLFASTLAVHAYPRRQSALLNLIHGTMAGGSCIGMLLTLPIAAALGAWNRVPLLLAVALGLVTVAVRLTPCQVKTADTSGTSMFASWLQLVRHPVILGSSAVFAGYILVESTVILFYPLYAQKQLGYTPGAAAALIGLFMGGIVAGRFVIAVLLRGQATTGVTSGLIATGGLLLLVAAMPWMAPAALPVLFVAGLLAGPTAPMVVGLAVHRVGHSRNDVLGLTNLVMCLGGIAGGILAGWWSDAFGLRTALLLSSLLFVVSAVPLAACGRRAPRQDQ